MTFLDRALLDHPRRSACDIIRENCPSDFFYEREQFCEGINSAGTVSFELCGNCWRREMPK